MSETEEKKNIVTIEVPMKKKLHKQQYSASFLIETAEKFKIQPFEFLMMVVNGQAQELGYETAHQIPLDLRLTAAKEAAQYLHPKRKAIEVTPLPTEDNQPIDVTPVDHVTLINMARGLK